MINYGGNFHRQCIFRPLLTLVYYAAGWSYLRATSFALRLFARDTSHERLNLLRRPNAEFPYQQPLAPTVSANALALLPSAIYALITAR